MSYPGDGQVGSWSPPGEESVDPPRPAGARELEDLAETKRKGVPFLLYRDDSGAQHAHALDGDRPITIGRGAEVNLCLAWDPSVSLLHADAVRLGAHWLIGDDGVSRNGTFVNGERLDGRRRLRDGDLVRVGRTTLTFNEPGARRRDATTITDAGSRTGTRTLLFTDL
ncbi:MAG: FHA domain-containing protein, partial [Actinomycetota bacterium]|nr:FHA domain-containing protein [Actinomycetota bacterium]